MWTRSCRVWGRCCAVSLLIAGGFLSNPGVARQDEDVELAGANLAMRLTGVIINNDIRSALIKIGNEREKVFNQGASLRAGVVLDSVKINYVLLSVNGQKLRLELEKGGSSQGHNPNLPDGTVVEAMPVETTAPVTEPAGQEGDPGQFGQAIDDRGQELEARREQTMELREEQGKQQQEALDRQQQQAGFVPGMAPSDTGILPDPATNGTMAGTPPEQPVPDQ